jgi:hypothetical protein
MTKRARWPACVSAGGIVLSMAAAAQTAPATHYTSFEAVRGAPLQVGYYASAHKDCTPAPRPTIRVVEAPKAGTLTVRESELTASRVAGCPPLKLPAQVLSYQARAGAAESDRFAYDVVSAGGEVATYQVTIDIKEPPKPVAVPSRDQKI